MIILCSFVTNATSAIKMSERLCVYGSYLKCRKHKIMTLDLDHCILCTQLSASKIQMPKRIFQPTEKQEESNVRLNNKVVKKLSFRINVRPKWFNQNSKAFTHIRTSNTHKSTNILQPLIHDPR